MHLRRGEIQLNDARGSAEGGWIVIACLNSMSGTSQAGASEDGQSRNRSTNGGSPIRAPPEASPREFDGATESAKCSDTGQREPATPCSSSARASDTVTTSVPSSGAGIVWSQAGATMVVPIGAPDPEAHRPRLSEAEIRAILDRKRRQRDEAIERRIQAAKSSDKSREKSRENSGEKSGDKLSAAGGERFAAAIAHDMELDLSTTNRQQLMEIGIELPPIGEAPSSSDEVHQLLWRVIYGLARLGIFLVDTEHLDDRALVTLLLDRILNDSVPDIPPNDDMTEFIGLCDPSTMGAASAQPVSGDGKPDGLMGPFDCTTEDGDDEWQPWGLADSVIGAEDQAPTTEPIEVVQTETDATSRSGKGRDSILPRPFREHFHRLRSEAS